MNYLLSYSFMIVKLLNYIIMLYRSVFILFILFCLSGVHAYSNDWIKDGHRSIAQQDFEMAIFYFSKAVEDDPNNIAAYLKRAEVYLLKGQFVKAADDRQKAYELDPDFVSRYYQLRRDKRSRF